MPASPMVSATDPASTVVADAVAEFTREDHLVALQFVATRCGMVLSTEQVRTGGTAQMG